MREYRSGSVSRYAWVPTGVQYTERSDEARCQLLSGSLQFEVLRGQCDKIASSEGYRLVSFVVASRLCSGGFLPVVDQSLTQFVKLVDASGRGRDLLSERAVLDSQVEVG